MLRGVGAGLVSSSCTSGRKGPGPKRSELTPGPGPEGTSTIVPTTGGHHPAGPRGVKAALRVSRGGPSPPSDSSLTPAHLAPAPSGVKLWDWGAPPRAQPPCPQCNRGSSPKTTSPPAEQAVTGTAGPARPTATITGTRTGPGRWTQHRNRCRGTGLLKLGAHDSDGPGRLTALDSEQYGPKEYRPREEAGARPVAQAGRRWCRRGKEGGDRFPHQGPIRGRACYPHHGSDGTVPWRRQRRSGSHRDGPEACSPGEVREVTRSLDGRGRGVYGRQVRLGSVTTRVGHHVQGPGTEAPAAAAR